MKIIFLDVYKKSNTRICKDTAGGYGTENELGPGLIPYLAEKFLKKSLFWPSLAFIQLATEIKQRHSNFHYKTYTVGDKKNSQLSYGSEEAHIFFICGSIVCFETELKEIEDMHSIYPNSYFIYCNSVGEFLSEKIPSYVFIVSGNYEFLVDNVENYYESFTADNLIKYLEVSRITKVINGSPEILSSINWDICNNSEIKNKLLDSGKSYPIITTRGCPYSCYVYCTYPTSQGRKVLHENVESVIKKLWDISNNDQSHHIIFRDPVFSINLKYSKELLQSIIDEKLNLTFTAELHLKNLDEEFIQLAKAAKFKWFKFGIESAHEAVRDASGRYSISNDIQKEKIANLNDAHIKSDGMFILCQPTDTIESCNSTIDYSITLGLDMAQFSVFTPYPGTPSFDKYKDKIIVNNYQEFSQFKLIYDHPSISQAQASSLVRNAHIKFYQNKIIRDFRKYFKYK